MTPRTPVFVILVTHTVTLNMLGAAQSPPHPGEPLPTPQIRAVPRTRPNAGRPPGVRRFGVYGNIGIKY